MSKSLTAGETAPADGIYRVTHYQHRMPHPVSIRKGTVLPPCLKCGGHVTFEFLGTQKKEVELDSDSDFKKKQRDA